MALKDYLLTGSYSRIERVDVMKDTETVDFYLTTYTDANCQEIISKNIRYTALNNALAEKCSCDDGFIIDEDNNRITCPVCGGSCYIAKNDYDTYFKDTLKTDLNVLKICYQVLSLRPEFANTTEV
jgi:hypothetical protein